MDLENVILSEIRQIHRGTNVVQGYLHEEATAGKCTQQRWPGRGGVTVTGDSFCGRRWLHDTVSHWLVHFKWVKCEFCVTYVFYHKNKKVCEGNIRVFRPGKERPLPAAHKPANNRTVPEPPRPARGCYLGDRTVWITPSRGFVHVVASGRAEDARQRK